MNPKKIVGGLLTGGALCVAFSMPAAAQVQTKQTEAHGEPAHEVKVERGEIVYVNGRSVVIKMEDGTLRHFDNVPDSVTFMVDGQPVNINNAKVGMKLEKQTVTTSTPKVVTTVQTVTGTVWQVSPPTSVILTLENGKNQRFNIPKGQKFVVDGQETDAFGLKKGMKVSAQKVTEVPETVITEQLKRTGSAPPPPPTPNPNVPMLIAAAPEATAPAPTAPPAAPATLPKTASQLPLVGLLGLFLCGVSLTSMAIRKIAG